MNMGIMVSKVMPIAKKVVPIAFGAISGALSVIGSQRDTKWRNDTDERLKALESLVKKD